MTLSYLVSRTSELGSVVNLLTTVASALNFLKILNFFFFSYFNRNDYLWPLPPFRRSRYTRFKYQMVDLFKFSHRFLFPFVHLFNYFKAFFKKLFRKFNASNFSTKLFVIFCGNDEIKLKGKKNLLAKNLHRVQTTQLFTSSFIYFFYI